MIAFMRNVQTGEIREVELDSDEMRDLQAEVYDHGDGRAFPSWEQTGDHAVRRIDSGNVNVEADLGYEDKPNISLATPRDVGHLAPDPAPHETLTAAEVEAGVGSFEEKLRNNGLTPNEDRGDNAERVARGRERVGRQGGGGGGRGPTKAELKAEADDLGIEGTGSMNKAELQAAIEEQREGAQV
jgi:hypothetical protein